VPLLSPVLAPFARQAMRSSPFVKPFEARCKEWETKLISMQEIIDEWLKCQAVWLYLEPIFSSEDIMRQMPQESKRFIQVDRLWRKTMAATEAKPNVPISAPNPNSHPQP
jgi:dynein heavy chain